MHRTRNGNWSWTLIVSALVLLANMREARADECDLEELNNCNKPLFEISWSSNISEMQLDKSCEDLRKALLCVQSYTRRCMDLELREVFNRLHQGTNDLVKDLCTEGEFRTSYLQLSKCSKEIHQATAGCTSRYLKSVSVLKPKHNPAIGGNDKTNENIKPACCSANELADCMEKEGNRHCHGKQGQFLRQLFERTAASNSLGMCDDFTRYPEQCRSERSGSHRWAPSSLGLLLAGTLLALLVSRGNS
ncbi:hypothetical protein KR009_000718 [Drosophila setifemur]|nr:hypothetical protein KR009_000718 [Drosophila setifemur]